MTTALLIVDLQNHLCTGRWAMAGIDGVVDRVNELSRALRAQGATVVLVQHSDPQGMAEGSDAWQLTPRLQTSPQDLRIGKTACDAFHKTGLQEVLRSRGVTRVVVCGAQSEFCIDSTVRGALAHGYEVTLVGDGHTTMDNGVLTAAQIVAHENATLANVDSYGPRVTVKPAAEIR